MPSSSEESRVKKLAEEINLTVSRLTKVSLVLIVVNQMAIHETFFDSTKIYNLGWRPEMES